MPATSLHQENVKSTGKNMVLQKAIYAFTWLKYAHCSLVTNHIFKIGLLVFYHPIMDSLVIIPLSANPLKKVITASCHASQKTHF